VDEIVVGFEKGDFETAKEIQLRLIPANAAVTSRYGIAGLKAALDLIGMYGGPVRPPLLPLESAQISDLKRVMQEAELL
jgi:4-hydroxy-2-oxoglutarate aldolase